MVSSYSLRGAAERAWRGIRQSLCLSIDTSIVLEERAGVCRWAVPRGNCPSRRSRDFPSLVWLQTASEMIVFGINLWPSRAHRVFEFLALLISQSEFFDQPDGTPVIRGWVAPRSGGSYNLAVDLLGNRSMDHVEVQLGEDNVCFPGRSQPLGLGRSNKEAQENWNNCFDQSAPNRGKRRQISRPALVSVAVDPKYLLHLASPHWHRRLPRWKRQREPGHWAELPVDSM